MKINLHKCLAKGFVYILLSVVATASLYASQYNEPRKVLSAIYKNALYKNLTVPGEMKLDTKEGRTFLMEIGKRPTYFWSSNNAFHLLQTQALTLNTIRYDKEVSNTFKVNEIDIPKAFFISEGGLSFSGLELTNNEAGVLVGHSKAMRMSLNIQNTSNFDAIFNANNMSLDESSSITPDNSLTTIPTIYKLKTRDLQINGINFVAPRMTITLLNGVFAAYGTARDFDLPNDTEFNESGTLKHYYGDWEVVPASLGAVVGATGSCGNLTNADHETCRKIKKGDEENPIWDDQASSFTCEGRTDAPNVGDIYDYKLAGYPDGYCYDYYMIPPISKNNYFYDNFEFKVQEVFRVPKTGDPTLIEQTPRFRVKNDGTTTKISKDLDGAWSIFDYANLNNNYSFLVNGNVITINNFTIVADNEARPCLIACQNGGGICKNNQLYIRNSRRVLFVDDVNIDAATSVTHWSMPSEQNINKLAIVEYTIGVCPAVDSSQYANYEANFVADSGNEKMMNGLFIPSGSTFVAPQVCLRRIVKCNHGVDIGKGKSRYYKPLTTDY